tara:strand:- start:887 stop:1315 length:429 start_codon:yes stop_codon:yes gene_type:complete
MANNWRPSWQAEVGLNYVPAYQVSGRPWATGSLDTTANGADGVKVEFPTVTRWVAIINNDTGLAATVGFSQAGLKGTNNFTISKRGGAPGQSSVEGPLEIKVTELWLSGSSNVDIVAGLTSIDVNKCSGSKGPSWSGSSGVG